MTFVDELTSERLTLKRTIPTLDTAQETFALVDKNREYFEQWLEWVAFTNSVEDSMKYLFDKEAEYESGKKVEYGIFLHDERIGTISMMDIEPDHKSGEIGYWLSEDFAGNGYMTEAVKTLVTHFFEEQHLHRIQIKCDALNIGSAMVAKHCGFTLEGTFRDSFFSPHFKDFRNVQVYSLLYTEWKK